MEYRPLGRSNLRVSVLCLGTMQFGWTADERTSHAILDAFVEAGGTFIDTADIYSQWSPDSYSGKSEEIIGRWINDRKNRTSIVLATKVHGRMWDGPDGAGLSRAHIIKAVEGSLTRLQTDSIDLYQTHSTDPATPHEETLGAMDTLIEQGKVRFIGCSNYMAGDLRQALSASRAEGVARFESLQPYYNLADHSECGPDLLSLCRDEQVGVIPYSPLAMGFLTGKYRRGEPLPASSRLERVKRTFLHSKGFALLDAVLSVAKDHHVPPATVALAWLLSDPVITSPIIGANTLDQLAESLPAGTFRLDDATVNALSSARI